MVEQQKWWWVNTLDQSNLIACLQWICNTAGLLGICNELLSKTGLGSRNISGTNKTYRDRWCSKIDAIHRGYQTSLSKLNRIGEPLKQLRDSTMTQQRVGQSIEFKFGTETLGTVTITGWNSISCSLPRAGDEQNDESSTWMYLQTGDWLHFLALATPTDALCLLQVFVSNHVHYESKRQTA